ncbi:MAG: hypothetical protein ACYCPF_10615, partial [Streptosporangiaceae bacterium]
MTIGQTGQPAAADPAEAGEVLVPAQRPPAEVAPEPSDPGVGDRLAAEPGSLAGRVLRRAGRVLWLAGRVLRKTVVLLLRAFGRVLRISGRLLRLTGRIGLRVGKGMLAALAAIARWMIAARTWRPVLATLRWLARLAGRGVAALLRLVRAPAAKRRLATAVVQASALAVTAVAIDTGQRRALPGPPEGSAGAAERPVAAPEPAETEPAETDPAETEPAAPEPVRTRPFRTRQAGTRPSRTRRTLKTRPAATARTAPAPAAPAAERRPRSNWMARIGAVATWTVVGVTLFICYLHVSRTSAVTSDGASNALQAWDMLHHNPLLRGWRLSDVSFYSTELPEYAAIEYLRGLSPDVVHVASALTYTMLVLLAALLAKGRATGRRAVTRCLVAGGIMLAPQAGNAVYTLMGSPDHMGSAVPVLIAFVLIDRAGRRWYTPIAVALVLSIGMIGDGIILYTGVAPIAAVGLAQAYQARLAGR